MGIEAIYPKRRTTWPGAGHKIYPYLLRNVEVTRPDQVWASDITYVPLRHGFLYLVAVMDWYSRYVLSWRLSNTLTGSFCLEALEEALSQGKPEIFNSDQGSQFTAAAFTSRLEIARRGDQHGWPRPSDRQRVHRAAVAEREVRGSVSATTTRTAGTRKPRWPRTSACTTRREFISRWATARQVTFIAIEAQAAGQPPDEKRIEISRNKMIAG